MFLRTFFLWNMWLNVSLAALRKVNKEECAWNSIYSWSDLVLTPKAEVFQCSCFVTYFSWGFTQGTHRLSVCIIYHQLCTNQTMNTCRICQCRLPDAVWVCFVRMLMSSVPVLCLRAGWTLRSIRLLQEWRRKLMTAVDPFADAAFK